MDKFHVVELLYPLTKTCNFIILFLYRDGQLETVKLLVDEGYCRVDIVGKDGWTAAVYAIMYVHFDVYTQLPRVLLIINPRRMREGGLR